MGMPSIDTDQQIDKNSYLAIRPIFILKIDGSRPIIYPFDYKDTYIHILNPIDGFILSLISGRRTLLEIEELYQKFFPEGNPDQVTATLNYVNGVIRKKQTFSGIGQDGLIACSTSPIEDAPRYDPRQFVISSDDFEERMSSYKTKRRLEAPVNALSVFTSRCSTNCAYCYADRQKVQEMSIFRWEKIIAEMHELGIRLCTPDNGDIFARKDGIDFLEILLGYGFHFLLSTKCYVSRDWVKRLIKAGFTKKIQGLLDRTIQLSIDAVDEEVQRQIYRVPPILPRTMETFDNFSSQGILPRIKAVITGLNVDQPRKLVDCFYPRGARNFHFVKYIRSFHRHSDELFLNPEHIESFKRQYAEIHDLYPDLDCWTDIIPASEAEPQELPDREKIWRSRKGCGGGWLSIGIAPDGKVFLCEQMKMSDEFMVGDLNQQSILEVWHSQKMLDFIFPDRAQFKGTICYSCQEFEQCMWERGRCYRDAYYAYGTVYDAPPLCPYNERPWFRIS
jgi:radical SAM protein with 4Fe4S-binding SPASM domain